MPDQRPGPDRFHGLVSNGPGNCTNWGRSIPVHSRKVTQACRWPSFIDVDYISRCRVGDHLLLQLNHVIKIMSLWTKLWTNGWLHVILRTSTNAINITTRTHVCTHSPCTHARMYACTCVCNLCIYTIYV